MKLSTNHTENPSSKGKREESRSKKGKWKRIFPEIWTSHPFTGLQPTRMHGRTHKQKRSPRWGVLAPSLPQPPIYMLWIQNLNLFSLCFPLVKHVYYVMMPVWGPKQGPSSFYYWGIICWDIREETVERGLEGGEGIWFDVSWFDWFWVDLMLILCARVCFELCWFHLSCLTLRWLWFGFIWFNVFWFELILFDFIWSDWLWFDLIWLEPGDTQNAPRRHPGQAPTRPAM